jgi:molybdopterin synthase catalytic subunit
MEIVTETPVDPGKMFEMIGKREAGSVLFHYAVVKSRAGDRTSTGILFERGGDMEAEMSGITEDIMGRWNVADVLLVRRIGPLKVGDVISLVAVSSPTSHDAFEACHYGLQRLRKMASLKKTEMFQD